MSKLRLDQEILASYPTRIVLGKSQDYLYISISFYKKVIAFHDSILPLGTSCRVGSWDFPICPNEIYGRYVRIFFNFETGLFDQERTSVMEFSGNYGKEFRMSSSYGLILERMLAPIHK